MTGNKIKNKTGNRIINKEKFGFTLIELIVSVALFSVIILMATQIFAMVIDSQRSSIATQNVQESLKYFLEVTGKEIRMAQKNDDTTNTCPGIPATEIFVITTDTNGNNILSFKNYYGQCVTYSLAPDAVVSTTQRFQISRKTSNLEAVDFISPAQITLDHLYFILDSGASTQATVTINLQAHALNAAKFKSTMVLQTSIASRYYK